MAMIMMRRWISGIKRAWRPNRRAEEGSGLAYVIVIGVVLLVFLIALVDVLTKEMRFLVGVSRRSQLVHGGDAGIDRALFALQKGGNWDDIINHTVSGYEQDVTYTDIPGMRYTIRVREGNWTPYSPALGPEDLWTPAGDKKL